MNTGAGPGSGCVGLGLPLAGKGQSCNGPMHRRSVRASMGDGPVQTAQLTVPANFLCSCLMQLTVAWEVSTMSLTRLDTPAAAPCLRPDLPLAGSHQIQLFRPKTKGPICLPVVVFACLLYFFHMLFLVVLASFPLLTSYPLFQAGCLAAFTRTPCRHFCNATPHSTQSSLPVRHVSTPPLLPYYQHSHSSRISFSQTRACPSLALIILLSMFRNNLKPISITTLQRRKATRESGAGARAPGF